MNDRLYELIGEDPEVLRRIDEIMLVDTPLHIAASVGQTCFAMEMMNLMPSFARKLNKSGLSPMHLVMATDNLELVLLFLEVDSDLVRVKGKGALTPMHFAVKDGNIHLLAKFLVVCPKSIEDVTVKGETALHIALDKNMLEALKVSVRWLQRVCHEDALKWKANIPNRKDLQGQTALDIALSSNKELEFIQLLAEINAKDSEGNHQIITSSTVQNRQTSSSDQSHKTLTNYIRSKRSFDERFAVYVTRHKMKISDNARSALPVVLGRLFAATYPAVFSPPGSFRQDPDDHNNSYPTTVINGTTHRNTTASEKPPPLPGTVVMDSRTFLYFSFCNSGIVHAAICLTVFLLPDCFHGSILRFPLIFLIGCYNMSILIIAPSDVTVRLITSLYSISMISAVYLILLFHNIGKGKLRRICYTSD